MKNEKKIIHIRSILFDTSNPRHDPSESQKEAFNKLLKDEDIRALAKDIINYGANPTERIIVMPHDSIKNKYVVLEGNRRVCAMKAILRPILCHDKKDRTFFETLSNSDDLVPKLEALIVDSRKTAHHWMTLKHGGSLNGIGTKSWTSTQTARYAKTMQSKNPNASAYLLLEYALEQGLITKEQHDQIRITTIARYLSNPSFRESIGFSIKDGIINTKIEHDKLHEVITRFLEDDLKGKKEGGLSSLATADERKNYGHQLIAEHELHKSKLINAEPILSPKKESTENKTKTPVPPITKRNNRSPNYRKYIIPSDFKAQIANNKLKRVFDELRFIDPDKFPNAAAFLLRAFMELLIHQYLSVIKSQNHQKRDLHTLIAKVADDLESKGHHKKVTTPLRNAGTTQSSPMHTKTFNLYVHGVIEPNKKDLILAWDPLEESFTIMLDEITKKIVAKINK